MVVNATSADSVVIEQGFAKNAACRIAGTQHEDVESFAHDVSLFECTADAAAKKISAFVVAE